jgi:4-hydroxyproline epimerase
MACLAADGLLKPGQPWRQEGILGTVFEGSFEFENGAAINGDGVGLAEGRRIIPTITGSAHVTAESTLIFDPADPFRLGVPE